jgi:ABC-type nickel/cobalt efflux system permease component RcnA
MTTACPINRRIPDLITARRVALAALFVAIAAAALHLTTGIAHAQGAGPFGVGAPEVGAQTSAVGIFGWIAAEQAEFYKALTAALKAIREDPNAAVLLSGLSFAYGMFHAAGPGHGKAVIASYIIANKQTLRRGIILSFVSALFQGIVAVAFVSIARFIFDVTAVQMTFATEGLELTSAMMITTLGLWLVATKVFRLKIGNRAESAEVTDIADAADPAHIHSADCSHALFGSLQPGNQRQPAGSAMMVCADCGSTHMPDPTMIEGPFNWRRAISAIAAVGVRPCSGAIIILVFAFSQRLYTAGVLSVLAMSLGTGITVAALATFAVFMKDRAVGLAGIDSPAGAIVVRSAEVLAALGVLAMGSLLLGATLMGGPSGG